MIKEPSIKKEQLADKISLYANKNIDKSVYYRHSRCVCQYDSDHDRGSILLAGQQCFAGREYRVVTQYSRP